MNKRIYFEKFLSDDDFQYYLDLTSNEDVMKMNYGRVFTLEESQLSYKGILKNNKVYDDNFGFFKVFKRDTNDFIGLCSLTTNKEISQGEVEYMLMPDYWGKGYGSEIVSILLERAKNTKSLKTIIAIADPNNIASRKILLNNGFVSLEVFEIDDGSLAEKYSKEINQL